MYKRYYDIDVDAKAYANRIVKAGGRIPSSINQVSDFIKNQKNNNLWPNLVDAWFFRGVHNINFGGNTFSIKNIIQATLNGGLTYGSDPQSGLTTSKTSSQYISTQYNLPSEFTLEIVYYISSYPSTSSLWGNEIWDGTFAIGQGYWANFAGSGELDIGLNGDVTQAYAFNTNAVKPITRYSVTQSRTTSTCYMNGSFGSSAALSYSKLGTVGTYFGARHGNTGAGVQSITNGNIFAVLIYNRALSATEISNNYNATKGRIDV
jgi:hypothetical protein